MLPKIGVTSHWPTPVAVLICTLHPLIFTELVPRLCNSMKSCVNVVPPPPYTWLMTTSEGTACAGVPASISPGNSTSSATSTGRNKTDMLLNECIDQSSLAARLGRQAVTLTVDGAFTSGPGHESRGSSGRAGPSAAGSHPGASPART